MNVENREITSIPAYSLPQQDTRLHEIFARLMTLTFHIGLEHFTLREFVLNNDLKSRVIIEITRHSKDYFVSGAKYTLSGIQSTASKLTPREIYKRRRLVVNLTVIGHLTTSASKIVKILMIQSDIKIKEINSIVKFTKKAFYFRNGDWGVSLRAMASNPDTFHKLLKLIYNTVYVATRAIDIGTSNTLFRSAVEFIDQTKEFNLFLTATSPYVGYLSGTMNPIKLVSKTTRFGIAFRDWTKIEYDDLPETKKIKRLELGKSFLDTSLIGLRIGLGAAGYSFMAQSVITLTAVVSLLHATTAIFAYIQKKNAAMALNSIESNSPFAPAG